METAFVIAGYLFITAVLCWFFYETGRYYAKKVVIDVLLGIVKCKDDEEYIRSSVTILNALVNKK